MKIENIKKMAGNKVKVRLRNEKVITGILKINGKLVLIIKDNGKATLLLPQEIVELEVL